jgi:glycosyltransferase involved in cell wall biosynthesis
MPLISIVIPVYNVEKYLSECLDSVLMQTFRDIEIICVDDGSTDRSPEILSTFAERDKRIIVLSQPNGGPSVARNSGVEKVRGKYILFVDSDDAVCPKLCEKVFTVSEQSNADMTIFFFDRTPKEQSDLVERAIRRHPVFTPENQTFKENLVFISSNSMVWARLWKTEYYRGRGLSFPVGLTHEDMVVGWQSLLYSPRLAIVPERLYAYRFNPDSQQRNPDAGCGRDIADVFTCIEDVMRRDGFYRGAWKDLFLYKKLSTMLWRYESLAPRFQDETRRAILAAVGDDEREYMRSRKALSLRIRDFYRAAEGAPAAMLRNAFWRTLRRAEMFFRKTKNRFCRTKRKNRLRFR